MYEVRDLTESSFNVRPQKNISKKSYPIYEAYNRRNLSHYICKVVVDSETLLKIYLRHLDKEIIGYMARKKGSRVGVSEEICVLVKKVKEEGRIDQIYLFRKMVRGRTVRYLMESNSPQVDLEHIPHYGRQMVSFLLEHGGIDNFIMSLENVFIDELGQMHFNFTSLVGIPFLVQSMSISMEDFTEILPYLTADGKPSLVRMIAVNLFSLLLKRVLTIHTTESTKIFKASTAVEELKTQKDKFAKIISDLKSSKDIKRVQAAEKLHRVRYLDLFHYAFVEDNLSLTKALSFLRPMHPQIDQETYLNLEELSRVFGEIVAQHCGERPSQDHAKVYSDRDLSGFRVPLLLKMDFRSILLYGNWLVLFYYEQTLVPSVMDSALSLIKLIAEIHANAAISKGHLQWDRTEGLQSQTNRFRNAEKLASVGTIMHGVWMVAKKYIERTSTERVECGLRVKVGPARLIPKKEDLFESYCSQAREECISIGKIVIDKI